MAGNLVVRQLGPVVAALSQFRQSIYQRPQEVIQGISEELFPNPLQPVLPMGPPKAEPLGWPFDLGRNLLFTPREDAEYTATDLRLLATYDLARVCIENNKDILTRMPHKVQLKPIPGETAKERATRAKNDPNLKKLNDFFDHPNVEQNWSEFWRPIIEDMLVIDAPAIFVERAKKDGSIAGLRWVEGSSIVRLIDEHGWTPQLPSPAYQQNWQGYPRLNLTAAQLIYKPRNIVPRNTQSSYLYGYSPTEQIAEDIKIGQARLKFILNFYSEGTIPGAMLFAPLGTPTDKIKEAQQWLDSDLAGRLDKRRRLQILQGFQEEGKSEQLHFPKEPDLADLFDDLHIRRVCFAYGTSPVRLQRMLNRASGEQNQEAAEEEGTLPFVEWLKSVVDYIIQAPHLFNLPNYEVVFDPFHEMDKLKQAMADKEDINNGLYTRNEKREERGDDPRPEPEADQLMITTSQAVVPLNYRPPVKEGSSGTPSPSGVASQGSTTTRSTRGSGGTSGSQSAGAGKIAKFSGCAFHSSSYPRTFCTECVTAKVLWDAGVETNGNGNH